MLKSTHRSLVNTVPLAPGWTEHKAPTGHPYYYNAATKESTYSRPSALPTSQSNQAVDEVVREGYSTDVGAIDGHKPGILPFDGPHLGTERLQNQSIQRSWVNPRRGGYGGPSGRKPPTVDRPKSKHIIPGCAPWLLVKTKLGRRFVYNTEEGQSYWKFPTEVMKCVIEYDRAEREKKEKRVCDEKSEPKHESDPALEEPLPVDVLDRGPASPITNISRAAHDSDDYEEVEVTDQEDEDSPHKRQKTDGGTEEGAVEFNEDDIAYQLAAMGQNYGLDPGEYGNEQDDDLEEGAEGLPLTEEDSHALFKDLLDDYQVSPYKPWEKIIEEGHIIEDDRYTVLTSMKARKEAWGEWSREKIQRLKEQREHEEKKDPRIPYLAFLQRNATPKLYWPEFRRKYKKEAEMRDAKLADKEREKWYRDYINRLKLPESTLKTDLTTLLKSLPPHILNRSTNLEALPPAMLTDIRYISLRPSIRDPLIEAYIATSPPAPQPSELSPTEEAELAKRRTDRERREKALAERERKVQEQKRIQRGALQYSKGILREGEEEIQRAMKVGREGLLGHLEGKKDSGEV
ncbi:MAG: hypothetical protein Q9187_001568 [Circinaria calcarea]